MTVSNEAVGTLLEVYGVENPFLTGGSHTAAMRAALEAAKARNAADPPVLSDTVLKIIENNKNSILF